MIAQSVIVEQMFLSATNPADNLWLDTWIRADQINYSVSAFFVCSPLIANLMPMGLEPMWLKTKGFGSD